MPIFAPVNDPEERKQIQLYYLTAFGIMIVLSTTFIFGMLGFIIFGNNAFLAYMSAFSGLMFIGGILGFFTVIIQRAVQEVEIKVVELKEE
jgi:nitrate reductase NapE component